MSEVNVFTDIGILEWDMSTISSTLLDIESRLQFIRPTFGSKHLLVLTISNWLKIGISNGILQINYG